MFGFVFRALLILAIAAIAAVAIAGAFLADALSMAQYERQQNRARLVRNRREVAQSKMVLGKESVS